MTRADLETSPRRSRFPKVTLTKGLLDSHVYIFKHSVLDLLAAYPQIESVREELVPWLVKGGYQTRLAKKWAPCTSPRLTVPRFG
jgi:translation initiation factor eIF-2B subunit gamma